MGAVRRARNDDLEDVVVLWLDLVEYHRSLDPSYPPLPELRETLRSEVRRGIRFPSCEILLAEAGGRVVGFAFAEIGTPTGSLASGGAAAWIHEIFVAPDERRGGLGRALAEAAVAFCGRDGDRVAVRVERGNDDGLAFWGRLGFGEHARILELAGRNPRR